MMPEATLAYFDCFSGASGDMLVGSLLDAGLSLETLRDELSGLAVQGYDLTCDARQQHGISGSKFGVTVDLEQQHHRHLSDIERIVRDSGLPPSDVDMSLAIFRRLARAEAKVHGTTIETVHFHEVGAVDSIIDVVGFCVGLRLLGIQRVYSSPLTLGGGFIQAAHGRLPVPVPATMEILSEAGVPTRPSEAQTELVTPTGAAILSEVATFRRPSMRLRRVGYGFGSREHPWINAVRVWLGEPSEGDQDGPFERDVVTELGCNIDDMTAEGLGYVMDRLFGEGALDVWFTPIQMKKNRPAVMLSALIRPQDRGRMSRLLLTETSTLGVRYHNWERDMAGREVVNVATPWGTARAKLKRLAGQTIAAAPEYEDCMRLARQAGVPLARVYEAVIAGFQKTQG